MVDAALNNLFTALDTNKDNILDAEEMRFLGKAVLGTMPSTEAAKYVFFRSVRVYYFLVDSSCYF